MVENKEYEFRRKGNSIALFMDDKEIPKGKYEEIFVELGGDSEAVRAFAKFCTLNWTVPEEDESTSISDFLLDRFEEQIKAEQSTGD